MIGRCYVLAKICSTVIFDLKYCSRLFEARYAHNAYECNYILETVQDSSDILIFKTNTKMKMIYCC